MTHRSDNCAGGRLKKFILEDVAVLDVDTGCWLWKLSKKPNGYGQLWWADRVRYAHQVSYEVHVGPITDNLNVLHTCDVRHCVAPAHLYLGTQKRNMADMRERKRSATGDRNGSRTHPERRARGARHGRRTAVRLRQARERLLVLLALKGRGDPSG